MLALLAILAGCAQKDTEETAAPALPPAVCGDSAAWSPGTSVFEERGSAWGLDGVEGVRLTAVDFDGDGWTDLHAARVTDTPDDFAAGGVRQTWLLRNDRGKFVDVTESSGFRVSRTGTVQPGSVVAWADVDNDGDLDAYVGVMDTAEVIAETSEILLNDGDGTFSPGPADTGARQEQGVPAAAVFTDYDLDGLVDLWVPQNSIDYQPQQDLLFKGMGGGDFRPETQRAGLETEPWSAISDINLGLAHSNAWSGAACDLNDDGWPELLAGSYGRAPNHLWQLDPDTGKYVNRSVTSGYAYDHRQDWSDNESARCWCKLNPDDEGCAGVPAPAAIACTTEDDAFRWNHDYDRELYRLGGNSATTSCRDVDNDGDLDLLTSEIVHWDVGSSSDPSELLLNDGAADPVFERPGNDVTGLTREHTLASWNDGDMTNNTLDFDNDGWADIYIGSSDYEGARGLLFHQVSPARFESVPLKDGINHTRSHGVVVADFDRDGDLDVIVGHSLSRCADDCYETANVRFFENQLSGNFVQLRLEGAGGSNRSAIGARVEVTSGGVTQVQEVVGGFGHYGAQNDLVLHYGLAAECEADVKIRWPDAAHTVEELKVTAGHRFHVKQGEGIEVDDVE